MGLREAAWMAGQGGGRPGSLPFTLWVGGSCFHPLEGLQRKEGPYELTWNGPRDGWKVCVPQVHKLNPNPHCNGVRR